MSPTGTGEPDRDGKRTFEKRFFTKKRYNHESKRNKKNKKTRKLQKSIVIKQRQAQLSKHTLKTAKYDKIVAAAKKHIAFYRIITKHYNNHQYRKLKFECRIAEQKTIDRVVNYITWEGTKVTGIGDCSKTTGFKSCSPGGPIKKIKRHAKKKGFKVCSVDEFCTSKVPACCKKGELIGVPDGNGRRKRLEDQGNNNNDNNRTTRLHGLRTCPTCHSTWNRDFSAGINIWDLLYNVGVLHQERPEVFSRRGRGQ